MKYIKTINESFFDDTDSQSVVDNSEDIETIEQDREFQYNCVVVYPLRKDSPIQDLKSSAKKLQDFFEYADMQSGVIVPVLDAPEWRLWFDIDYDFSSAKKSYKFIRLMQKAFKKSKTGVLGDNYVRLEINNNKTNVRAEIVFNRQEASGSYYVVNYVSACNSLMMCSDIQSTDVDDIRNELGLYDKSCDSLDVVMLSNSYTDRFDGFKRAATEPFPTCLSGLYRLKLNIIEELYDDKFVDIFITFKFSMDSGFVYNKPNILKYELDTSFKVFHKTLSNALDGKPIKINGRDIVTFGDSVVIICTQHEWKNNKLYMDLLVFLSMFKKNVKDMVLEKI